VEKAKDVVKAADVNWYAYFKAIRKECPWSFNAFVHGKIDIRPYEGRVLPLEDFEARVYIVHAPNETVEALAAGLDYGEDEWLFSYPGYGPFATPVPVLIQQNRAKLKQLREQLDAI
jgi:hypothetical protein